MPITVEAVDASLTVEVADASLTVEAADDPAGGPRFPRHILVHNDRQPSHVVLPATAQPQLLIVAVHQRGAAHRGHQRAQVTRMATRHGTVLMTVVGVARGVARRAVGVEMIAGGGTLVAEATKLVDMHGVAALTQPKQEASEEEAGDRLDGQEGAGHIVRPGHHFDDGTREIW